MTKEKLKAILKAHNHWLNKDCEGWEEMRADLTGANLYEADLYFANLQGATLAYANLRGATLCYANLSDTDFTGADLEYSDLRHANLDSARLNDVNLYAANLYGANLNCARVKHANLAKAYLSATNLSDVVIADAKCTLREYRKGKIITEDIKVYKKCRGNVIVTLIIPRGAIVFSINGYKCRTNKAKVIAIDGADRAYSYINRTSYYVGDEFNIYNFNCEYNEECAEGIHFFMTREQAENY